MQKILILGLPGSGKTYLAAALKAYIEKHSMSMEGCTYAVDWLNADEIRKTYNDWDFSHDGRIRQSIRMAKLALESLNDYVIADFVAPLVDMRNNFKADWTIWMDTIDSGRFEDTNKAFVPPEYYDFRITEKDADKWAEFVGKYILGEERRPVFDWQKETVQMLGRWQPWHAGHRALFERLLEKTGQVVIQIRDCQGWQGSNPFELKRVENYIKRDLDPLYQGRYTIQVVPNIVHIGYGRKVGYTIAEESFDEATVAISGTEIRKSMGLS